MHAYPFVTLHQTAAIYGVNSRRLERTPGEYEHLSSKNEILAYYEAVLNDLLATGRVSFFPLTEANIAGPRPRQFKSLINGAISTVSDNAKIVDATYTRTQVPSTHGAHLRYAVEEGVDLVPINDLPSRAISANWECYCVIGAGKTGIDAVLWLLGNGVAPRRIKWITPNDSWLFVREAVTPPFFYMNHLSSQGLFALIDSTFPVIDDLTHKSLVASFEKAGLLARIDPNMAPTKFKGATASRSEIKQLRRVRDIGGIVRLGRVLKLAASGGSIQATLEQGKLELPKRTLFVDCSTDGTVATRAVPVFNASKITLQTIWSHIPLSAAAIARLEAQGGSDAEKNKLATVIPFATGGANARRDISRIAYQLEVAKETWKQDRKFWNWLTSSRLMAETHSTGLWISVWKSLKRPKTALRLVKMNQKLAPALRRVCIQEGGDC